ncbi:MAG TPA: hypothetical protein VIU12_01540 [Chryseolinea sp.]
MKNVIVFLCLMLGMACFSYAQVETHYTPQTVIPPSPDVAALGKYGSIPVGLNTGIPEISIPLFTINTGKLSLPISLSYHASGIKVSELASWVGLGFSLNAGGVISRTVVGLCDEGGFWSNTVKNSSQITGSDEMYIKGMANVANDPESDLYFFNFNGHAGKFIYRQNDNQNPLIVPKVPIKINYLSGHFEIVDETGTLYIFARAENMTGPQPLNLTFNSAYHLTEIVSADQTDHIYLTYTTSTGYSDDTKEYTWLIGENCSMSWDTPYLLSYDKNTSDFKPISRGIIAQKLDEINWSNGKIKFIPDNTRLDGPTSRLAEIQIHTKNQQGAFILQKSYVLDEDYFQSTGGNPASNNYRLKLKGLSEKDANGIVSKNYSFYYDETQPLPHRLSLAQDWWGYYNGKVNNTSLIATEDVNFVNHNYPVGGGSRTPDSTYMRAGTLNKIVYPTGGYTEFYYGANVYSGTQVSHPSAGASVGESGNTTTLFTKTITITPTASGLARIHATLSDVTNPNPFYSTVIFKEQNAAANLVSYQYDYTQSPHPSKIEKDFTARITAGKTYELTVKAKGTSTDPNMAGAAFVVANVTWDEYTQDVQMLAGGLRIRKMRDFESPTAKPVTRIYKYGTDESGSGVLLSGVNGVGNFKQIIELARTYPTGPAGACEIGCYAQRMLISGRPATDLTGLGGSSVVYPEVAVYEESDVSKPNGKEVYNFTVVPDVFDGAPSAYNNGVYQSNESWSGGDEIWRGTYKKVGADAKTLVKEVSTSRVIYNSSFVTGTKVGWKMSFEGCGDPVNPYSYFDLIYYFDYYVYSGLKATGYTLETDYSSTDPTRGLSNRTDYFYDNLADNHQQVTRIVTRDSEGLEKMKRYWYPADYNNTGEITPLLQKNIIATPIKEETYRDNQLLGGTVSRLNSDGKPFEVYQFETTTPQPASAHNPAVIVPSGYVKKADIGYDGTTHNINKVQLTNNLSTGYLWSYNNTYPIAKIENADVTQVAATSFEAADNPATWTFSGTRYNDIAGKTGKYYYKLGGGSITKSLAAGTYKLEYFTKGTAVTVAGGTVAAIRNSAADANGWIYYEKEITLTATTTITISGASTAFIDELRLYPKTALMTTYTYELPYGLSTVTDPSGAVVYYDYDTYGRLKWIRDVNGSIVKAVDYHYKGH